MRLELQVLNVNFRILSSTNNPKRKNGAALISIQNGGSKFHCRCVSKNLTWRWMLQVLFFWKLRCTLLNYRLKF